MDSHDQHDEQSPQDAAQEFVEGIVALFFGLFLMAVLPSELSKELVRDVPDNQRGNDPTICPECSSNMVQTVGKPEVVSELHFMATLRCVNCHWFAEEVLVENADADRFNDLLDAADEAFSRDFSRAIRQETEDWTERFIRALRSDALLPEDF